MTAFWILLASLTAMAPQTVVPSTPYAKALGPSDRHDRVIAMDRLHIVPFPQRVIHRQGSLEFPNPTLYASSSQVLSIARVLADDILTKTGVKPKVVTKSTTGAIELRLVPNMPEEAYRIDIDRTAMLVASDRRGMQWAASSLLHMVQSRSGCLVSPKLRIDDQPDRPYRGLMIDVARRWHSIDVLKQCVILCHLYKLNYLQLHLSDDQAFTFPSRAFPLINTQNQHGGPSYSEEELKDLVKFADDRGVTIIPEMDIPGHSATLNRAMPDLFKIKGAEPYEHHASIDFVKPEVLKAIDTLIGEMCDIFRSSPFFHMGGDEADLSLADQNPVFQKAFRELGLPPKSQQELFRRFIGQVDEMVKKHGKKLIVWEGFGRDPKSRFPIPKDILVMEFENAYYLPGALLEDGYSLVNASWTPLYVVNRHVWPARKVFEWDLDKFGRFSNLYPTTEWVRAPNLRHVEGAEACSWEGPEELEIENLRRLVPAMAERLWNPRSGSYAQFASRMAMTDGLLERLVHPVTIECGSLDATDPNGYDVPCFTKQLSVRLHSSYPGTIRYTLDGKSPTSLSTAFAGRVDLTQSTTIRAAVFSTSGHRLGYETSKAFYCVPTHIRNLAVGKKVTVSGGTQGGQTPDLVVDDNLDLASSWWAGPAPQWLQVDLAKVYSVDRIEVFPYWDGSRYYQYTVEVSADGKSWTQVADRSKNTTPSNAQGDLIKFGARQVRYVKVNMLRGSANDSVHLVELRVWAPGMIPGS